MNKNLIFRTDVNTSIGTGHIMRCIALAQEWQARGGQVTFLSCCRNEALRQRIIDEGFDFIPVEISHPDPNDLDRTLEILKQLKTQNSEPEDWVVIDGYHFTPDYQKAIRKNGYKLLVIDDMAHLDYYHADILLNQNIHASSLRYFCDKDTVKLFGCEYVLLRREFFKYTNWKREIPEAANKILVTMGGSDPDNVTLKFVKVLKDLNNPDLKVKIIVGPANPNLDILKKVLRQESRTMQLLRDVNMPELMVWADMAISAGGSTCWEMAFMGLPFLSIALADNQLGITEGLDKAGAGINLGWYKDVSIRQHSYVLQEILRGRNKRLRLSEQCQSLVNGKGSQKVVGAMCGGQVKIREAQEKDCELLWKWANEPEVRVNSFSPAEITYAEHANWFKKKLTSPDALICILDFDQIPVAQIRYDRVNAEMAEIDFLVAKKYRGKGLGQKILKSSANIACNKLGVKYLRGVVISTNKESLNTFKKAGFRHNGQAQICDKLCHVYVYTHSESYEEVI